MIDIENRIVTPINSYTITIDGVSTEATIEQSGTVVKEGTPVNRKTLLAIQGFISATTVFNADGSITETNENGDVLQTTLGTNQIVEVFTGANGSTFTKTITFETNGTIKETAVE